MTKLRAGILIFITLLVCLHGRLITGALADDSTDTQATVTVLQVDYILLAPSNPTVTISPGDTQTLQFIANAVYTNNTTAIITGSASWTSSNLLVATIGSHTGQATILINGTTTISATYGGMTQSTTLTVQTPTSTPPSNGGGGGGGGGGGVVGEKRITSLISITTQSGRILEDVVAQSADVNAELFIKKDTIAKNRAGAPLTSIIVERLSSPPGELSDTRIIGKAYDIGPNGTQFEPPVSLTLSYNEQTLPAGIQEKNLYVATWSAENEVWEKVPCVIDTDGNKLTASINHLSTYTIMTGTRPANMVLSQLKLNPVEVNAGNDVSIGVLITNTGDIAGSYNAVLKINNKAVDTKIINLNGQASQNVTFTTNQKAPGSYIASIGTLSGTFTVKTAPAPSSAPVLTTTTATKPAALPTTSPARTPTVTGTRPPAVVTTPVSSLPEMPAKNNWTNVKYGAVGVCVVVLIILIIRQTRRR